VLRVAHYLNQFFGQIGAEDKASVGVSFRDGPVAPALSCNSGWPARARSSRR
jgi:glycine reductase complex component B subunit gamma